MSTEGKLVGRYQIIRQIGQGGMAEVYRAMDTRLQREVALKLIRTGRIPPDMLPQLLKRFEREARAQARFNHPNIVPIYDFGEHNGAPYLVMGYMPGGTVKALTGKPMPYRQAAALLAPIAEALAYAQQRGVLHRDVKPSNILIDEHGQPALTDFGIAKLMEEVDEVTLTRTGLGIGTPGYMSPEQWRGKPEKATDIYALGVVFYEMITGQRPYQADTSAELAIKQVTEPLPLPGEIVDGLPEEANAVTAKALAPDPGDRYPEMAEFAAALGRLSQGSRYPSTSVPESRQDRAPAPTMLDDEGGEAEVVEVQKRKAPQPEPAPESQAPEPTGPPRRSLPKWAWGVILGAALIGISLLLSLGGDGGMPFAAATSTQLPILGSSYINQIDGATAMYIPAGSFLMGSEDGDADEQPVHEVYLDAFWMYQTEVTNAQFAEFLNQTGNLEEGGVTWLDAGDGSERIHRSGIEWLADSGYEDHPVIEVSWFGAAAYCEWAGGRLPTEAEWEKAARGGLEGKDYPWGDDAPTCTQGADNGAQFDDCSGETIPAASFGANGYGLHDMAGNVWEWVADWYDSGYYDSSPGEDTQGPGSGASRVLRGGSWSNSQFYLRVAVRVSSDPDDAWDIVGFRCVIPVAGE